MLGHFVLVVGTHPARSACNSDSSLPTFVECSPGDLLDRSAIQARCRDPGEGEGRNSHVGYVAVTERPSTNSATAGSDDASLPVRTRGPIGVAPQGRIGREDP